MFDWIKKLFNIKKKKCSYELKKAILCSTIFSIGDNTKDEETFKSYFIFMCDQVMNNNLSCIANNTCINSKFENTAHILYILRNETNLDKMLTRLFKEMKLKENK